MEHRRVYAMVMGLRAFVLALLAGQLSGCFPCGTFAARRVLRAVVLDRDTREAPNDVVNMEAWTSTDGEFTGSGGGGRPVIPSLEDGSFDLRIDSSNMASACGTSPPRNLPAFPAPDEILVIVEREACEQRFTIDINEDTVVDPEFPGGVIELKDPILVPPCEAEEGDN